MAKAEETATSLLQLSNEEDKTRTHPPGEDLIDKLMAAQHWVAIGEEDPNTRKASAGRKIVDGMCCILRLVVGPCPAPSRIVVHFCLCAECCVRVLATHSDVSARTALQVRSLLLYSSQTVVVRSAHGLPMLVELTLHFSATADASAHSCKQRSTISQ